MNKNEIYKGTITYINYIKKYGFIQNKDNTNFFFYFGNISAHQYLKGDFVKFKLKLSEKDNRKEIAYDLKRVGNSFLELLLKEYYNKQYLSGYLKHIDNGKYNVKHIPSDIEVPVHISVWKNNIYETYNNRINKIVKFKLKEDRLPKVFAYLSDISFCPELKILQKFVESQKIIKALITGRNDDGYFATIIKGKVKGFIYCKDGHSFRNNNYVKVKIKRISEKTKQITLIPA